MSDAEFNLLVAGFCTGVGLSGLAYGSRELAWLYVLNVIAGIANLVVGLQ